MAIITVDRLDDVTAADGQTTLREAIASASSGDTIEFATAGTITLTQGELQLTQAIIIDGDVDGDDAGDITISGGNTSRVLNISAGVSIFEDLTITNGSATAAGFGSVGGGAYVQEGANATFLDVDITNNASTSAGTGIYSVGTLRIEDSNVSDNSGGGAGVYASGSATGSNATIVNSTVSGNVGSFGAGGVQVAQFNDFFPDVNMTIVNSTISGNRGTIGGIQAGSSTNLLIENSTITGNGGRDAGGIFASGGSFSPSTFRLINSTVTGNASNSDGGVIIAYNSIATPSAFIANSIIAGNKSNFGNNDLRGAADITGTTVITYNGVNVFGTAGLGDAQDIVETDLSNIFDSVVTQSVEYSGGFFLNFAQGELADNGGPVQTVAILDGGVAHDAGDDAALPLDTQDLDGDLNTTEPIPFDARGVGFDRLVDGQSDVGAFEIAPDLPADAIDDAFTITESQVFSSGNVFAANPATADSDPDSPLMVTQVNGNGANVGIQITLASGALLTVNTDGTFVYDPNGAFQALPDIAASGSLGTTDTDSFTYELNGDDTATVTFTINGEDSDGDILTGSAAGDLLIAGIGNDTVNGDDGEDVVVGGTGDDSLNGDGDADLLVGGLGADILNGGLGFDTAFYGNSIAVTVDLTANNGTGGEAEGDTFSSVENVRGSTQNDVITGDALANALIGLDGDDILQGMAGGDALLGGAGNDTASYAASNDTVNVNLSSGTGAGAHAAGDVLVDIENLTGSEFGDLLRGGSGVVDNALTGLGGGDLLLGDGGDDRLFGGAGGDVMTGGAGNDSFIFDNLSAGQDIIIDFDQNGDDRLTFTGFGPGFDFGDVQLFTVNGNDVFVVATGWQGGVVLKDALGLVDAGDFVFV